MEGKRFISGGSECDGCSPAHQRLVQAILPLDSAKSVECAQRQDVFNVIRAEGDTWVAFSPDDRFLASVEGHANSAFHILYPVHFDLEQPAIGRMSCAA